ncbi:MAG: hypothetical protein RL637_1407 [Pseudomonadota bacterium]|jgi:1-acyl-sn-glycerol-3-phosphate acyltransferase
MPPVTSLPKANLRVYLGSTAFFIYSMLSLLFVSPVIIAGVIFPFEYRYRLSRAWCHSVLMMEAWCCGIHYRIEGSENIPQDRPVVVLSKHQSAWETLAFRYLLPTQTVLAKRSLLWIPLGGWAFAVLKPITIDRSQQTQALRALLEQGTQALAQGLWVVVFPEGTRTAVNQKTVFNAGGAMLACKAQVPILPLAHNAGAVWPRYSFLKYPGIIQVKIGPVIETVGQKPKQVNAQAEQWVAEAMKTMNQTDNLS